MNKNKSPYLKKLFNMLNTKIKKKIENYKSFQLETKFSELKIFNESSKKHCELIKSFEKGHTNNQNTTTIKENNQSLTDQQAADEFGLALSKIFSNPTSINHPPNNRTQNITNQMIQITFDEFMQLLKQCNLDASPGIDNITNKTLKNFSMSTLERIHTIFEASLKYGFIPPKWKISKIVMMHKKTSQKIKFSRIDQFHS